MKKLVASTSIGEGSLWLYVDNKLILTNSEQVMVDIEEDQEHIVHWYANGAPGASYTVAISAPRNAEFQLTKKLGSGGKDFGGFTCRF